MKAQLSSKQCRDLGYDFKLGGTLTENRPKRTPDQNAMLWPICRALGQEVGLTAEGMYDELACEIFGYDLVTFRGTVHKRPLKRPSKANREEFSQLLELALQWAAEMGINVAEVAA